MKNQNDAWTTSFWMAFAIWAVYVFIGPLFFGDRDLSGEIFAFFLFPIVGLPLMTIVFKLAFDGVANSKNEEIVKVDEKTSRKQKLYFIWSATFWLLVLAGYMVYRIFVTK